MEVVAEPFAVADVVEDVARTVRQLVEANRNRLVVTVDPNAGRDDLRRVPAEAGPLQPPLERRQVHGGGDGGAGGEAGAPPGRRRPRLPRRRHRHRHERRAAREGLHAVRPGRRVADAPLRRHGPRPRPLAAPLPPHGGRHLGDERGGGGDDLRRRASRRGPRRPVLRDARHTAGRGCKRRDGDRASVRAAHRKRRRTRDEPSPYANGMGKGASR